MGDDFRVMIDANQHWSAAEAIHAGRALAPFDPFWFEEPVHPDDLAAYLAVKEALSPMRVAGGEHIPNQVVFKNFLAAGALDIAQPDAVRLGGLPEYLAVALMAAKSSVPVLTPCRRYGPAPSALDVLHPDRPRPARTASRDDPSPGRALRRAVPNRRRSLPSPHCSGSIDDYL